MEEIKDLYRAYTPMVLVQAGRTFLENNHLKEVN